MKLLPDETQSYKLLKPVGTTGEERLKEFGLRTRQYKELFEAWETLHIGDAPGNGFIRDDVIQRIQRNPQIASSLSMGHAELIQYYESYRSTITRLATLLFPWTAPYFSDHLQLRQQLSQGGRGLVFTAGNSHAPYLLTSIPVLRQLGCHLPIEVMYLGDDDLQQKYRTQLEAHAGVVTRDLRRMVNDAGWELRGWAGKPFSVLLSSFREVIFIDADSLFLQNPADLFDDPAYNETGALFFKDRLILPESKKDWLTRILPPPISKNVRESRLWSGESGHMQESGVLVIDTWRHFVPLLLVTRMNGPDRDGDSARKIKGVYEMLFGKSFSSFISSSTIPDGKQVTRKPFGSAGSFQESRIMHSTMAAPERWELLRLSHRFQRGMPIRAANPTASPSAHHNFFTLTGRADLCGSMGGCYQINFPARSPASLNLSSGKRRDT